MRGYAETQEIICKWYERRREHMLEQREAAIGDLRRGEDKKRKTDNETYQEKDNENEKKNYNENANII